MISLLLRGVICADPLPPYPLHLGVYRTSLVGSHPPTPYPPNPKSHPTMLPYPPPPNKAARGRRPSPPASAARAAFSAARRATAST